MDETREYEWTDNPTVSGESDCDTDILNECLMHLKYNNSGGDAFPMFSTIAVDHILTGEDAIGWALQGSLITNTYTDAVAQIKDEYTNATQTLNYQKTTPIVLPTFTSNTTGGITVSDSRGNTDAYTLINGVTYKYIGVWNTYWFNIDYGKETLIKSYFIKADSNSNPEYPSAWTLQASNDGSQWDVIDTRSGQTFTLGQSRTFIVTTDTAYKQYRLIFSDGLVSSGNGELGQLGFNADSIDYSFDYKKAQNGHLIADISYKSQIDVLFSEKGVADFYILDSVNNQFYLPRTKWFHQFTVETNLVNNANESGLPNITGEFNQYRSPAASGAFKYTSGINCDTIGGGGAVFQKYLTTLDASMANSVYGRSENVQPPSSNKLLYYKVGNTIVNESEIDVANLTSDVLSLENNKANADLSNCTKPHVTETYSNGASWYRVYSDGWCEQGGTLTTTPSVPSISGNANITFLKNFANTNYSFSVVLQATSSDYARIGTYDYASLSVSGIIGNCLHINANGHANYAVNMLWRASGYILQGE